jgi:hypothetical protein
LATTRRALRFTGKCRAGIGKIRGVDFCVVILEIKVNEDGSMKQKSSTAPISPGRKLGPAGKRRPPKVEKLKGDEVPPPEQASELKRRRG